MQWPILTAPQSQSHSFCVSPATLPHASTLATPFAHQHFFESLQDLPLTERFSQVLIQVCPQGLGSQLQLSL